MQTFSTLALLAIVASAASACAFERDTVEPGYYGIQSGAGGAPGTSARPVSAAPMSAGGSSGSSGSSPTTPATAGSKSPPTSGAAGSGAGGSMGQTPSASAAGTGSVAMQPPQPTSSPTSACSLSGRWIATMHLVADALGELQYTHYYHYFEIEQSGDAFTIKKGLLCGYDSVGVGDFAATADFHAAWASTVSRVKFEGWKGTSSKASGGCKIDTDKWYTIRGATNDYLDPSLPLPGVDEKASGTTPGWEDWDADGNPGITGVISGLVSGKIFVAPRLWTAFSGTAADVSSAFEIPTQWNQEQNVMSYDGTPLLASEAARAADMTLHYSQLVRLSADQATGDDLAICKSIVELAPTLTPKAAGN